MIEIYNKWRWSWLLILILMGSSCEDNVTLDLSPVNNGNLPSVNTDIEFKEWTEIEKGLEIKQIEYSVDQVEELFTIVRITPTEHFLKIAVDTDNPHTVDEWQQELDATVVMNGAYFDENYNLTTRTIVDKESFGPLLSGNTAVARTNNGKQWDIAPIDDIANNTPLYSIQSYPLLISNGEPRVTEGSANVAQRTILAQDEEYIYCIIAEYGVLSLQQLDDALLENIQFTDALNLDGGTSTGLIIQSEVVQYQNGSVSLPSVLYIE